MAEYTTNYSLRKPDADTDLIDVVSDVNVNMDTIDTSLKAVADSLDTAPVVSYAVWAANETRTSTTAITSSTEGTIALEAGNTYLYRAMLICGEGGGAFKMRLNYPGTLSIGVLGSATPDGVTAYAATALNMQGAGDDGTTPSAEFVFDTQGTANPMTVFMQGVITGTTAGNLILQWAQNVSNATASTLMAGSFMMVQRVA